MAHGAFNVLDSDIHIIEPPDLWPRPHGDLKFLRILWDNCAAYYGLRA